MPWKQFVVVGSDPDGQHINLTRRAPFYSPIFLLDNATIYLRTVLGFNLTCLDTCTLTVFVVAISTALVALIIFVPNSVQRELSSR